MSGTTLSHGAPSFAAPKGTVAFDVDTPDVYQNMDGAVAWTKILRAGTAITVAGLTITGFSTGILHSVGGVVSSSAIVATDIANNTITGAQLARGGTNQVFFSASAGVDPAFTATPTLATSLSIGTSSAAPASDALVLARHANSDRVSLVWAGETGAGTWRMGMPTGASSDIAVRLWYTATGNSFNETSDTRFYFATTSNQFVVASDGVVATALGLSSDFNGTNEARIQMLSPQAGAGRILRVMGHGSTGGAGGDVALDAGDGVTAGVIRLRIGTAAPITRLLINANGTLQASAYTTAGLAHFDTSGNITSAAVNLASADVTGILPVGNLPVSGGGSSIVGTGRTVTGTAPVTVNGVNTAVTLANNLTIAVSNATTGAVGVVQLAGDLAGTATSIQVAKVKGTTVSTAGGALTTGQSLRSTGVATADWGPIDLANANAVTGTLPVANLPVSGGGSSVVGTGRTLTGSGAIKIASDNSPHDLSADRTISVASATTLALGVVQLTTDLGGTATAPVVVQLTGSGGTIGVLAATMLWDRSVSPFWGQTQAASGAGALWQWQAQQGAVGSRGGICQFGGGPGGTPGTDLSGDTYCDLGRPVSNATAAFRVRSLTNDVFAFSQSASGVAKITSSENIFSFAKPVQVDQVSTPSLNSLGAMLWTSNAALDPTALLAMSARTGSSRGLVRTLVPSNQSASGTDNGIVELYTVQSVNVNNTTGFIAATFDLAQSNSAWITQSSYDMTVLVTVHGTNLDDPTKGFSAHYVVRARIDVGGFLVVDGFSSAQVVGDATLIGQNNWQASSDGATGLQIRGFGGGSVAGTTHYRMVTFLEIVVSS